MVGLHKASFIVWLGAASLHVLAHIFGCPVSGGCGLLASRCELTLVGASLTAGAVLATATLPAADRLQDQATGHIGLDAR